MDTGLARHKAQRRDAACPKCRCLRKSPCSRSAGPTYPGAEQPRAETSLQPGCQQQLQPKSIPRAATASSHAPGSLGPLRQSLQGHRVPGQGIGTKPLFGTDDKCILAFYQQNESVIGTAASRHEGFNRNGARQHLGRFKELVPPFCSSPQAPWSCQSHALPVLVPPCAGGRTAQPLLPGETLQSCCRIGKGRTEGSTGGHRLGNTKTGSKPCI